MNTVSSACTPIGRLRGPAQADTAQTTAGSAKVRSAAFSPAAALPLWRQMVTRSISAATPARMSSSHTVPGVLPVWKIASVSAPYATNSPCGMKMTRVTVKTSTMPMPSRA